jgi:uncharacterized protein (TIGR00296 family)
MKEGMLAVRLARKAAEDFVSGRHTSMPDIPKTFSEKRGAFVSLHTYPEKELRGCIGYPEPVLPLKKALEDCAVYACQDSRFEPVQKQELAKIIFEVSILTKPEAIKCAPKDYPKNVKIGEDGLIIRKGFRSGLLLPQVPVEWKWDVQEFLEHLCEKAGLDIDAWKRKGTEIHSFQAQIFSEKRPGGDVVEKEL